MEDENVEPTPPVRLRGTWRGPDGDRWSWGPVDDIHTIGPYKIVEYREDMSRYTQRETWHRHGRTLYYPIVDGEKTHRSYTTLDRALLGAVAVSAEGSSTRADVYMAKMLGLDGA